MKLLIDENLPRILVERLTRRGDDVLWARERLRGAADEELIAWHNESSERSSPRTRDSEIWSCGAGTPSVSC